MEREPSHPFMSCLRKSLKITLSFREGVLWAQARVTALSLQGGATQPGPCPQSCFFISQEALQ